MNWLHAKKADADRIYLPYQEGERGLMNIEKEYKAIIVGLHKYLKEKNDIQVATLFKHQ